jgi:hypothetical protein
MLTGEAPIDLCFMSTGTYWVAETILRESFREEVFWYLHIYDKGMYWYKAFV